MLHLTVNYATRTANYTAGVETLGDRIRSQRGVKGYSQQDLATIVGVTKGAVSQWENGRTANVKLATVLKLCQALGCTLDWLVHGTARSGHGRPPSGTRASGPGNTPT